jgi:hypothetical protein
VSYDWDAEWALLNQAPTTDDAAIEEVRGALQIYFTAIPHMERPREVGKKGKKDEYAVVDCGTMSVHDLLAVLKSSETPS